MKAITVKQPWASLIVHGIKDIENRTWPCPNKYIGQRVLIHASAKPDREPYMLFNDDQKDALDDCIMDVFDYYRRSGSIIGSVEIVDCTFNHPSIWAEKSKGISVGGHVTDEKDPIIYNWVLANPILFANPIPAKGKLSFWNYDGVIEEGGKL